MINLSGPGMVYFLACTIVPDDPSSVDSWKEYFCSVRRRYFGGLCVWTFLVMGNTTFLLDAPLVHRSRVIQLGLLAVGLTGLSTESPTAHALIFGFMMLVAVAVVAILLEPGALVS